MKKKIMAVLLAALMLGGAATVSALSADETQDDAVVYTADENGAITLDLEINLIGDANGNGSINLMDYRAVLQHVKGTNFIEDAYFQQCADANQNGSINLMDYRAILQHVKGTKPLW